MRIDIVTIFPAMVENALRRVVGRAIERGTLDVVARDLRVNLQPTGTVSWTTCRTGAVPGWCSSRNRCSGRLMPSSANARVGRTSLTSPQGTPLTHDVARV
jgi:tRNA G37 N-methylase TrmD